ncbi:hypothetical protein GGX14DRAFT_408009, partial [Mycena pura]
LNEWDSELLAEALGDYMTIAHKDLLRIMYNKATEATGSELNDTPSSERHVGRVTVLFGAEVTDVDCDSEPPVVTMRSGDIYRADAVIGADGPNGIVRRTLMQCEGAGPSSDVFTGVSTYSAVVPRALIAQDRDLDSFYEYPQASSKRQRGDSVFIQFQSTISMGPGRGLMTEMAGQSNDLFIFVLAADPEDSQDGTWRDPANNTMADIVGPIKKLAALAGPAAAMQNKKYYKLSSWVAESGRVAVIGEAAHPLRPCAQHTYSAALEDGVFIGKIFSHSHDPSRIPELLYAFEEHRQVKPRCEFINNIEQTYCNLVMMPDGEAQEGRDAMMRANHAAGRNVFHSEGDMQEMLEETHQLFGYDAADDADEWWVSWGRYRNMEQN